MKNKESRLKGKIHNVHEVEGEPPFFWKEDIEKACNFFLKYKDYPVLFNREQFKIDVFYHNFQWYLSDKTFGLIEYNEWLFRLAFSDIYKEDG